MGADPEQDRQRERVEASLTWSTRTWGEVPPFLIVAGGYGAVMSAILGEAHWTLPSIPASVPEARRLVARELTGASSEVRDVVLLLASELVTNAVRHGRGAVTLHVTRGAHRIQVEVDDEGRSQPAVQGIDTDAVGGRGLLLLDELASQWGVDRHSTGKTVWFRFPTA